MNNFLSTFQLNGRASPLCGEEEYFRQLLLRHNVPHSWDHEMRDNVLFVVRLYWLVLHSFDPRNYAFARNLLAVELGVTETDEYDVIAFFVAKSRSFGGINMWASLCGQRTQNYGMRMPDDSTQRALGRGVLCS